jgi:hypothetical protein
MPGIGGIVFLLVFGVIVTVWSVWIIGRDELRKEAEGKNNGDHKPSMTDT